MKKIFKQITMAALVLGIVLNMASLSYAATVAQYRLALDACNQKYNINLEYIPVAENADLQTYMSIVEDVAKNTRSTMDFMRRIENRKISKQNITCTTMANVILKEKSKTVSAYSASDGGNASPYKGTATYHIAKGNVITDLVSFSARYENKISAPLDVKTYDVKTYTTHFYDAGHTLGITAKGKLVMYDDNYVGYEIGNVTTMYMYSDTY